MNVIDYITITCNLKKCPITDYIRLHEKCNRLQPITITNYDYPMSDGKQVCVPGYPTDHWSYRRSCYFFGKINSRKFR